MYQYLTLLGCRFLRPGKEYEWIPSVPHIEEIQISRRQKARYRHRGVCIEGADTPENILEFIDWLPKLGYNSFFLQFELPYAFLNLWSSQMCIRDRLYKHLSSVEKTYQMSFSVKSCSSSEVQVL